VKLETDLTSRDDIEAATAFVIGMILQKYRTEVLRFQFGEFFDPTFATPTFQRLYQEMAAALMVALMAAYKAETVTMAGKLGINPGTVDNDAFNFAQQRTKEIVQDFKTKLEADVRKAQAEKVAAVLFLGQTFNPRVAAGLAATHVTAAANTAETHQVRSYQNQPQEIVVDPKTGIIGPKKDGRKKVNRYWITRRDTRVCPKCEPLHNQPEEVWGNTFPFGPPAHYRCRCYLSTEIVDVPFSAS
jgi:hypothetical protein